MKQAKRKIILQLFTSGKYFCDRFGFVYSRADRHGGLGSVRKLKPSVSPNGYFQTTLCGSRSKRIYSPVHQLVALFFLERKYKPHLQVNHIDGNKLNNSVTNLELVTSSENHKHAHRLGLENQRGEKNNGSKLTWKQVHKIREHHKSGVSCKKLGEKFNVSPGNIHHIVRGATWVSEF